VAAPEVIELSVVLVNHNGADCLPAALGALARNTETESVECVVVDSGSSDDSWQDVAKLWDQARAIRFDENIGFCSGCNRGAEAARGRLLAFVNFDSLVEEDWDRPLRELLEDESVAVATGLMLTEDGETLESVGLGLAPNTAAYGRQMGMPRSAAPEEPVEVAAASGGLMMVRCADFLTLGGFYEPIFMYGEEADYCLRVPGKVVLHPGSASRHESGHASGPHQSPVRIYWSSRNRLLNAARHLSTPALVASVLASGAFDAMTLAQTRSRPALGAIARGWRDGLRLMPRERRARLPQERREATRQLASFREALAEQRRLGRLGWARRGSASNLT
jgi:GT2 family glycosyltransferase